MSISADALKEDTRVWESLGPISSGGTVFGLAISPVSGVQRYWAATGCGIFFSDDDGATWIQNLNGLTTPLLSALTIGPNGALFAGALGGDLFSSFDFGKTWEVGLVPDEYKATVTVIVTSPNFRRDGSAFAATDGGGLLVSRGSGASWEDSSFGLGDPTVLALATAPDWSRRETMFAATLEGVFISMNGGRAWRETDLMIDEDAVDVLAVSPAFEDDRTVYAGTEDGGLYRSTDGGRRWDLIQPKLGEGPINCLWLSPDFADSGRMVAGVGSRIYLSTDGGESWTPVAETPSSMLALTGDEHVVLAGFHDAGIWKSVDGGSTWASSSDGFSARGFARLVPSGEKLYAMGPQEGLWVSENDGQSWRGLSELAPYLPLSTVSAPAEGDLFVASQEEGILKSGDHGQTWKVVCDKPGIQAVLAFPGRGVGWAGTAEGKLLTTRDGGETWDETESPCEGQEILSLVASPAYVEDRTLFMGTSIPAVGSKEARVALWRSTNGGGTWRQLTTQVTPARWVDIEAPAGVTENVAEQAVLATGPYCLRPLRRAKDVWISTRVDPGGANTLSVAAIGEIDSGGVLFAATGNGIHRSIDGGRTWQPFVEGLGAVSFISIVAASEDGSDSLFALSLGGLVWKRELT